MVTVIEHTFGNSIKWVPGYQTLKWKLLINVEPNVGINNFILGLSSVWSHCTSLQQRWPQRHYSPFKDEETEADQKTICSNGRIQTLNTGHVTPNPALLYLSDQRNSYSKRAWIFLVFKSYNKPRQHIKKQRHHFANKGSYSQSYVFSSSHVQMWELDHKEGWVPKKWCFPFALLEKILESPLDCKEIKPVNPKGTQPWIFIGRTDSEAEAPIF